MPERRTLATPGERVAAAFDLAAVPALSPRYNIDPGQPVAVVGLRAGGRTRGLVLMTLGLVPLGVTAPAAARPLATARAETAHRLPASGDGFRRRRCLVVADGFYAWQRAGLAATRTSFRL